MKMKLIRKGSGCRAGAVDRRPPHVSDEEGRIGILLTALVGIVAVFTLVMANISAIHIQHRQALDCADSVALAGGGTIRADGYFCDGCDKKPHTIDLSHVRQRVESHFQKLASNVCHIGDGAILEKINVIENNVVVEMKINSQLVFLPPIVSNLIAPEIAVKSKARLLEP